MKNSRQPEYIIQLSILKCPIRGFPDLIIAQSLILPMAKKYKKIFIPIFWRPNLHSKSEQIKLKKFDRSAGKSFKSHFQTRQ